MRRIFTPGIFKPGREEGDPGDPLVVSVGN